MAMSTEKSKSYQAKARPTGEEEFVSLKKPRGNYPEAVDQMWDAMMDDNVYDAGKAVEIDGDEKTRMQVSKREDEE